MTVSRLRLLVFGVVVLVCGILAVGWRIDHQRVACYRDAADEQLVADGRCEHPRLR